MLNTRLWIIFPILLNFLFNICYWKRYTDNQITSSNKNYRTIQILIQGFHVFCSFYCSILQSGKLKLYQKTLLVLLLSVTFSFWTTESKLETENDTWWPLGSCFGSLTDAEAAYGPTGSFDCGSRWMMCILREGDTRSQITSKSPKFGDSICSNPNTC